jgi:hypothetical protein
MLNAVLIDLFLTRFLCKNFSLFLYFCRYICRVDVAERAADLNHMIKDFKMTKCIKIFLTTLSFCGTMLTSFASDSLKINKKAVFAASSLGSVHLFHNKNGFAVKSNGQIRHVQRFDVDPQLRAITSAQLVTFIKNGGRLEVNKMGDDYGVKMRGNVKGGGVIGATIGAFTGKFIVHLAAQGAYAVVAGGVGLVCPPAAPAVWTALQLTCAGPVELASNAAAVAGGIAVGTVTGPI